MRRGLLRSVALALLGASVVLGCAEGYPPKPPPPAVHRAPDAMRPVAIHVHQLESPPENAQDEWDYHHMPGLTGGLREAFMFQLARAGYTVVVDRRSPCDLVAVVQAEWPYDHPGVATLTLTAGDRRVEQISVEIPIAAERKYDIHLEEHAAVALVEAMNRSRALAAFAREFRPLERRTTRPYGELRVAAPPTEPSEPAPATLVEPAPSATPPPPPGGLDDRR